MPVCEFVSFVPLIAPAFELLLLCSCLHLYLCYVIGTPASACVGACTIGYPCMHLCLNLCWLPPCLTYACVCAVCTLPASVLVLLLLVLLLAPLLELVLLAPLFVLVLVPVQLTLPAPVLALVLSVPLLVPGPCCCPLYMPQFACTYHAHYSCHPKSGHCSPCFPTSTPPTPPTAARDRVRGGLGQLSPIRPFKPCPQQPSIHRPPPTGHHMDNNSLLWAQNPQFLSPNSRSTGF